MILETHPNIELTDFTYEVVKTIDNPKEETFTPHVHVIATNIRYPIHHELPSQPYINGTWNDDDVQNAVNVYFANRVNSNRIVEEEIKIEKLPETDKKVSTHNTKKKLTFKSIFKCLLMRFRKK